MLGIYYLDYSDKTFPRSARKMIIGYTRSDLLAQIAEKDIPEDYYCWLSECRTRGYLFEGRMEKVTQWIELHMPEKFGEPLRDTDSTQR